MLTTLGRQEPPEARKPELGSLAWVILGSGCCRKGPSLRAVSLLSPVASAKPCSPYSNRGQCQQPRPKRHALAHGHVLLSQGSREGSGRCPGWAARLWVPLCCG